MASVFDKLLEEGLIPSCPRFLKNNICYEVITGSVAYGANLTEKSDFDIVGVGIPSKDIIFPHTSGYIEGFSTDIPKFEQFQQHHINYKNQKEYDLTIVNIVKYFRLCMDNNPNTIDTLFVPQECITQINHIGQMIRENRKLFLHKGSYYKFSGFAISQLHKMSSNKRTGKRKEVHDTYGFDLKFAMHLVRLAYEAEQILVHHDLDLRKNSEHLKAIRRGEIKEDEIRAWFSEKEKYLEKLYHESTLRHSPDEDAIKQLLFNCLEHHFGSLDKVIINPDKYENATKEIRKILDGIGV